MPAKNWKPIRVTNETAELLDAVKSILLNGHEKGRRTLRFGPKNELPNDEAIAVLCRQFLAHNQRSKA